MKKCLFVYNPTTGGGRLKNKLMDILCLFSGAGYELTVCPTAASGDARRFAAEKGQYCDLAVCCGGDGTLNEMVQGLMMHEKRPVLGYIPGGTTNDFAASLHLPKSNMLQAANRILHPKKLFCFDVGHFNDRVFNYVAAFGAFTDVSYSTPQTFKNLLGYFAYILEALQRLPSLPSFKAQVTSADTVLEDHFLFGMVANSTSVGGIGLQTGESKVRLDDGLFELLLIRNPRNLTDLGELSTALLTKNITSPWLTVMRVSQVSILSPTPIPWTLDGEFGGEHTETYISVQHKALQICI